MVSLQNVTYGFIKLWQESSILEVGQLFFSYDYFVKSHSGLYETNQVVSQALSLSTVFCCSTGKSSYSIGYSVPNGSSFPTVTENVLFLTTSFRKRLKAEDRLIQMLSKNT